MSYVENENKHDQCSDKYHTLFDLLLRVERKMDAKLKHHWNEIKRLTSNEEKLWHGALEEIDQRLKNLEEKSARLESENNTHCEAIVVLERKVDKLEQENKMRQDTISCIDRAYDEECEKLENRLNKLENFICDIMSSFEKRFIELEKEIPRIYNAEQIALIANSKRNIYKNPHKCPVCDGLGKLYESFNNIFEQLDSFMDREGRIVKNCYPCEGRGIVWI